MLLYSRICVREPCVKPLEPLGKEGQLVGETQETGPCSQLPIETFIATDSVNPLGPPGLPSDVSHSKEDMPKGELSLRVGEDSKATREGLQDMDLHGPVCTPAGSVNPVCTPGGLPSNVSPSKESIPDRVLSLRASEDPKSMRQGPKDIGLFNPGSCSFSSKDLECCSRGCFSCQTHTVEIASPVEFTHKGVPYLASSNEVSSIEAYSLESELSSSTADVESSFKEGIGADSNYGKDLLSLQTSTEGFLSSQNNAHEMAETSFEVSGAALSSVAETLCEANHASSESLPNLSLEQVVTIKSGKCSPAALSTAIKISKLAGDNSLCRGNMKPLFSPGFLNKSTRNRSLKRHEKAQPCEVGSSGKVDHSCNGFSKPCFSYQNSDEVNDHGQISLNCGSLLASPSFIETQSDLCLNKDEEENKVAGEVGDCCNNDECNGDVVSILSDKNGSNNFNCGTGQEKFCGNGKDHLVGYRVPEQWPINNFSPRELNPPSSPGYLVNHDGKISSNLDGKAQTEPADVGSACMVDMNCNRIVEPGFPHPNIGEVNDHGAIDLDSNNKLSSRFVEKQPKNSLNKDEMVNKELGEVGKPCNGSCRRDHGSVLSDENGRNIYNRDAGQETFYGNGRDQLIDCRRPLLSARYNDEPLKRNSLKIGEDRELSETIHHPKNETNCKRLADGGW